MPPSPQGEGFERAHRALPYVLTRGVRAPSCFAAHPCAVKDFCRFAQKKILENVQAAEVTVKVKIV